MGSKQFNFDSPRVNGYTAEAATHKSQWHTKARAALKKLATTLGYVEGHYDIRTNMAGPAICGETTLHTDSLYVQAGQSSLGSEMGLLIRSCKGRKDYTGGGNRFAPTSLLNDVPALARRIQGMGLGPSAEEKTLTPILPPKKKREKKEPIPPEGQARLGPYMYVTLDKFRKVGNKEYRIVLYGAYNAMGLIGTECNGLAIFSNTDREVICDQVACEPFRAPTQNQKTLAQYLLECTEAEFRATVNAFPRLRHTV